MQSVTNFLVSERAPGDASIIFCDDSVIVAIVIPPDFGTILFETWYVRHITFHMVAYLANGHFSFQPDVAFSLINRVSLQGCTCVQCMISNVNTFNLLVDEHRLSQVMRQFLLRNLASNPFVEIQDLRSWKDLAALPDTHLIEPRHESCRELRVAE